MKEHNKAEKHTHGNKEKTREHSSRWITDPTAGMHQRLKEREIWFILSEPVRFTPYIKGVVPVFFHKFSSLLSLKPSKHKTLSLLSRPESGKVGWRR